jgi:hypothetical protein
MHSTIRPAQLSSAASLAASPLAQPIDNRIRMRTQKRLQKISTPISLLTLGMGFSVFRPPDCAKEHEDAASTLCSRIQKAWHDDASRPRLDASVSSRWLISARPLLQADEFGSQSRPWSLLAAANIAPAASDRRQIAVLTSPRPSGRIYWMRPLADGNAQALIHAPQSCGSQKCCGFSGRKTEIAK